MAKLTILSAPSRLGLSSAGVEQLPKALLEAGLAERIGASKGETVPASPHDPTIDPATGILNLQGIAAYTPTLADAIEPVLSRGDIPIVLGGDCSILLGCLLAIRRRGLNAGLLFLDGHADFFQPAAEPEGEVASMDLAIATGWHDSVLAEPEGRRPLIEDADVVAFGRRDEADAEQSGSQRIENSAVRLISLSRIREIGLAAAVDEALSHLSRRRAIWLHLDADVLDPVAMPAVDYILEGGLSAKELAYVLGRAFQTGRIAGMNVTILNPTLDDDGSVVARFVDLLAIGMQSAAPAIHTKDTQV